MLFPRRPREQAPIVTYLEREEALVVEYGEGRDLSFLRTHEARLPGASSGTDAPEQWITVRRQDHHGSVHGNGPAAVDLLHQDDYGLGVGGIE